MPDFYTFKWLGFSGQGQFRRIAAMKQSRFTDERIIGFLKQADAGMCVKELCRSGNLNIPTILECRFKTTIFNVDKVGNTSHFMSEGYDTGPIITSE